MCVRISMPQWCDALTATLGTNLQIDEKVYMNIAK